MDVVTAYLYGLDQGTDFLDNPAETSHYISAFQTIVEPWTFFASTEMPQFATLLGWLGINLIPASIPSAVQTIESFGLKLTGNARNHLNDTDSDNGVSSRAFRQLWQRLDSMSDNMSDEQKTLLLTSDMVDQAHAGHAGTGISLTYLMWELSRHCDIQDKLRDDFTSLRNANRPLESSSLLDSVLMETFRLYPASGGPFPRVAPFDSKLGGFTIPAKTIVSASPYTLGRNSDVFPDPESWLPERWERITPEKRKQMKQWVWSFLSGSRVCIGEHLAILGTCHSYTLN